MARPKVLVPAYSKHSPSGQAVVYIDRKRIYLGPHNSPGSRERYAEIIAGRTAGTPADPLTAPKPPVRLSAVCLKFVAEKLPKYVTSTGEPSAEQACFQGVIRIVRELFGETSMPVTDFGPVRFRAVRSAMIAKGWSRRFINKQCGRLRHIIRFGVGWEMVPPSVLEALRAVESLQPGDSDAPELPRRQAVPMESIDAMKRRLGERNRDLVDLMLLTAARPGELFALTTGCIDRTGEVWKAELVRHKTAHRGKRRVLIFNVKAQAILGKYLLADPDRPLFPSQRKTFSQAIKGACERAGVSRFTAHWLRHTAVTRAADEVGIEGAQRLAGHDTRAMTEHYLRAAEKQAIEAAKRLG